MKNVLILIALVLSIQGFGQGNGWEWQNPKPQGNSLAWHNWRHGLWKKRLCTEKCMRLILHLQTVCSLFWKD